MLDPPTGLQMRIRLAVDVRPLRIGEGADHPAQMHQVELLLVGPRLCHVVNFEDTVWSCPGLRR